MWLTTVVHSNCWWTPMTPIRVYHVRTLLVQENNFKVEHQAGKMNQDANELSRAVDRKLFLINHSDLNRFIWAQRDDRKLIILITKFKEQPDKTSRCYVSTLKALFVKENALCWSKTALGRTELLSSNGLRKTWNKYIMIHFNLDTKGQAKELKRKVLRARNA